MKAFVGKTLCLLPRCAVDPHSLSIGLSSFSNSRYSNLQFWVHDIVLDNVPNVVFQIEWAYKQYIDPRGFSESINLFQSSVVPKLGVIENEDGC